VAEALELATIPRRPAWLDSDPRWRRRMLAGVWILAFLPLLELLQTFEWFWRVRVPAAFFQESLALHDTFLCHPGLYSALVFSIGSVLLFSNERGRWVSPLRWTRRWGIICSYVVFLLTAAQVLLLMALVLAGIASLFLGMPLKYQPVMTQWFVDASWVYLRYGPSPRDISGIVLVAFSSIIILLACVSLFEALRSSGPKWAAAMLPTPLAFFALMHLAQVVRYCLGSSRKTWADVSMLIQYFFWPQLLVRYLAGLPTYRVGYISGSLSEFIGEAVKWSVVFAIAVWLTIAQISAWRHGRKAALH
jgi:hypothetical protein